MIKRYREFADTGTLFGCEGPGVDCSFIAFATSTDKLLIVCYVRDGAAEGDPPSGCMPLVFFDQGREWIAIRSNELAGIGGPEHDYSFLVFMEGPSVAQRILKSVTSGLSGPPLRLKVSSSIAGLKGLTEPRMSPVLDGWRENARINVSVDNDFCIVGKPVRSEGAGTPPKGAYCILYSVQLWVNRQNTANAEDWHRPSELLEKKYEATVGQTIRQSLTAMCNASSWEYENVLRCKDP